MISTTKNALTRRAPVAQFACAAFALCLSLLASAPLVRAQSPAPTQAKTPAPRLSVSVGLENNHLVLGQPIVLRYAIRSDNPYFSLPFEQPAPWMRVTLRDASGKTIAESGVESVRGAGSLRLIGWDKEARFNGVHRRFGFADGGAFVDRVFFGDQRLRIPSAGSYTLVVDTTSLWSDVPETIVRGAGGRGKRGSILTDTRIVQGRMPGRIIENKPAPDGLPSWASEISQPGKWDVSFPITQHFVFPLTVERDPERLTQIAEAWREKVKTQPSWEVSDDPLLELFNLYGAPAEGVQNLFAAEYAVQPMRYGGFSQSDLLSAVVRMGTPETIDWALRYKEEHLQTPDIYLDTSLVYWQADRDLQKLLLQQLKRHGQKLSEHLISDL